MSVKIKKLAKTQKDKHRGEELHIVGSGPSINAELLKSLDRKTTIVCNQFPLYGLEVCRAFSPSYVCIGDPAYCNDAFDEYKGNPTVYFRNFFDNYPGITVLTSSEIGEYILSKVEGIESIYGKIVTSKFAVTDPLIPNTYHLDPSQWLQPYQNILCLALQYGGFFGASLIVLHGFEHTPILKYPPEKSMHYFYSSSSSIYNEKHEGINNGQMEFFRAAYITLSQYQRVLESLKLNEVSVINATPGTLLDIFPKGEFKGPENSCLL
jgi:hypothetical protein